LIGVFESYFKLASISSSCFDSLMIMKFDFELAFQESFKLEMI